MSTYESAASEISSIRPDDEGTVHNIDLSYIANDTIVFKDRVVTPKSRLDYGNITVSTMLGTATAPTNSGMFAFGT